MFDQFKAIAKLAEKPKTQWRINQPAAPAAPAAPVKPVAAPARPDTSHYPVQAIGQAAINRENRRMPYPIRLVFAMIALAFGLPLWFAGARFTRDGWYVWLNIFFDWIHFPIRVEVTTTANHIATLLAFGIAYSTAEQSWRAIGWVRSRLLSRLSVWQAVTVFALLTAAVILTDVGSTAVGIAAELQGAKTPIAMLIRDNLPIRIIIGALLTYIPDWAILFAISLIIPQFIKAWIRRAFEG